MDNLAPHKSPWSAGSGQCGWRNGSLASRLFTGSQPYREDVSKVKELLRSARARTQDALVSAIGKALKSVTADDALHWFASCG